jgi:hypothetical protein
VLLLEFRRKIKLRKKESFWASLLVYRIEVEPQPLQISYNTKFLHFVSWILLFCKAVPMKYEIS